MQKLSGVVKPYSWGSHELIAKLSGKSFPTRHPEAELWFSTHPAGPALLADNPNYKTLVDYLLDNQTTALGSVGKIDNNILPFMVKILAAEMPLSLQAHPNKAYAQSGFKAENNRNLALDNPNRNYKDNNHKPELLIALNNFELLAGFQPLNDTIALIDCLQIAEFEPYLDMLINAPNAQGLRALFTTWITLPNTKIAELQPKLMEKCINYLQKNQNNKHTKKIKTILGLAEQFPNDPGVLSVLLLNKISLRPGQAVFLPPGILHAYISGLGVEVMACSDNVLRGGLTMKYVDVAELLRVINFKISKISDILVCPKIVDNTEIYSVPTKDFKVSKITLSKNEIKVLSGNKAGILLCTQGDVKVISETMTKEIFEISFKSGEGIWLDYNDFQKKLTTNSTAEIFWVS